MGNGLRKANERSLTGGEHWKESCVLIFFCITPKKKKRPNATGLGIFLYFFSPPEASRNLVTSSSLQNGRALRIFVSFVVSFFAKFRKDVRQSCFAFRGHFFSFSFPFFLVETRDGREPRPGREAPTDEIKRD